ncbi:hypothetical protein JBE04_02040 [Streptomyces sp. PRKS01-29]|nr:hypothetical protein [Streptomyces sabulosicollis]MBI0293309.1 hypothetical protein [Streptomyces sabulosicollis]
MNITVTPNGTQPPRVIQVAEGAVTSVNGERGDVSITAADLGAIGAGDAAGGDLSGTYPNPAVAKVNGVAVTGTPTSGQVPTATSGTAATWQTPVAGPSAATTVTAQTSFGAASNAGSASTYSKGDHTHGTPTLPNASTSTAGVVQLDGTAADIAPLGTQAAGSTGKAADAGHVHPTTGVLPTAGGTMTGGINSSLSTSSSVGLGVFVNGDTFDRGRILASGQIEMGSGSAAREVVLSRTAANQLSLSTSDFRIATAGRGLMVAEGSNAKMGTATLSAGSATVSNTSVTSSSRIFLTCQTPGGTAGFLRVSARTAGTSFTITSSSGSDTSVVAWMIVEPA